jgi:hypothetical protein
MMRWRIAKHFRRKKGTMVKTTITVDGNTPEFIDPASLEKPEGSIPYVPGIKPYVPGIRIPEISYHPEPYVEPTDKEMILGLEESEHYAEACRIRELKKEVANLKRKLTILQKKYDGETK